MKEKCTLTFPYFFLPNILNSLKAFVTNSTNRSKTKKRKPIVTTKSGHSFTQDLDKQITFCVSYSNSVEKKKRFYDNNEFIDDIYVYNNSGCVMTTWV